MTEQVQSAPRTPRTLDELNAITATIELVADTAHPTNLPIDATFELANLVLIAQLIHRDRNDGVDLDFTSILLSYYVGLGSLSRWFARYVEEAGVDVDAMCSAAGVSRHDIENARDETVTFNAVVGQQWRPSTSARTCFASAQAFITKADPAASDKRLGPRHLMAALIYLPDPELRRAHEPQLRSWGLDRVAWSNAFLGYIAQEHGTELAAWSAIHRAELHREPEIRRGPSPHIATDIWTEDDALGYQIYADAIYRFMTHPRTKPPLTISIQAPWGGGKTSLMRMIQRHLDPRALPTGRDAVPDAFRGDAQEARQPEGGITVKQVLADLNGWIRGDRSRTTLPEVPEDSNRQALTVWFNAWKYESTNQVWAGMVDAVMQQVAARLSLVERERFWLRLNLRRVDADKIRHRIYERILRYWWRIVGKWLVIPATALLGSALLAIVGGNSDSATTQMTGWIGAAAALIAAMLGAAGSYLRAQREVEEEPAAVSLSEYLRMPDYSEEVGFIHHVEADMRRVLASVPAPYWPIVIFIDDLDRCSPAKVADVIEAVNLFLAGDFPDCMFVIGMDSEMVAAALQAAHEKMIACLPEDAGIPVGWRFMDKFVQLPFVIPPTEEADLTRYLASLFVGEDAPAADPEMERLTRETAPRVTTRQAVVAETERVGREQNLTAVQSALLKERLELQFARRVLDQGIAQFNDMDPEIRRFLGAAMPYFRGNPRELKRFLNAFRFQYFLRWARIGRGLAVPSLDQLLRWMILSMKWPQVVRWLRRGGGSEWQAQPGDAAAGGAMAMVSRLQLLEEISGAATNLTTWQAKAHERLRLTPTIASWLEDDDLLHFLHAERTQRPDGDRLSDGMGKGVW